MLQPLPRAAMLFYKAKTEMNMKCAFLETTENNQDIATMLSFVCKLQEQLCHVNLNNIILLSGKYFNLRGISYLFSVIRQGQGDR